MEINGENSGPLTSLPVNRLTATDCNADRSYQLSCFDLLSLFKGTLSNLEVLDQLSHDRSSHLELGPCGKIAMQTSLLVLGHCGVGRTGGRVKTAVETVEWSGGGANRWKRNLSRAATPDY